MANQAVNLTAGGSSKANKSGAEPGPNNQLNLGDEDDDEEDEELDIDVG